MGETKAGNENNGFTTTKFCRYRLIRSLRSVFRNYTITVRNYPALLLPIGTLKIPGGSCHLWKVGQTCYSLSYICLFHNCALAILLFQVEYCFLCGHNSIFNLKFNIFLTNNIISTYLCEEAFHVYLFPTDHSV